MKLVVIAAAIVLVVLALYSYYGHDKHYPTIKDLLSNPGHNGRMTEQWGVMLNKTDEYFYFRVVDEEIKVVYKDARYPRFGFVTVYGRYWDGVIRAENVHYNDYNNVKYIISIFGFFIFAFIFFREWRITRRGFTNAGLG